MVGQSLLRNASACDASNAGTMPSNLHSVWNAANEQMEPVRLVRPEFRISKEPY